MKCTEPQEWEWKGLHKPEEEGMKDTSHHHEGAVERGLALHAWQRWPGWIAQVMETEASMWESHTEQKDAVSLSCVGNEAQDLHVLLVQADKS